MSDDPYKPPLAEVKPSEYPHAFPTVSFIVVLLIPLVAGAALGALLLEAILALYPIASLFSATMCTKWIVASRPGASGCAAVFIWFGFVAFYAVAFFVGCIVALSGAR